MRILNPTISGSLVVTGSTNIVGVLSASFISGDGSGLTGVTSYTDSDTLSYINSIGVVSSSAQLSTEISGAFSSTSSSLASRTTTLENAGYTTCTGTVTSITAGTYLTGGTISTSGTFSVDATNLNTASKIVARDSSGNFCAETITATCFVETSAQKCKTDIENFSYTDCFSCLRPVSFKWKETGNEDMGFIAEELNQYYPTLVAKNEEDEPIGVKYTKMVSLLVKKVQEQDEQISKLKDIINGNT